MSDVQFNLSQIIQLYMLAIWYFHKLFLFWLGFKSFNPLSFSNEFLKSANMGIMANALAISEVFGEFVFRSLYIYIHIYKLGTDSIPY